MEIQVIQTLLKWIADNEWDWQTNGPAKIGGAMWAESYGIGCMDGLRAYCDANPEQYELVDIFLPDFKFNWATEVEALKDCDYVIPPVPMNTFAKQLKDAGHEVTYVGTDAHLAFMNMIGEQNLWDALDGMVLVRPALWWTDEGEGMDLTKTILQRYRPNQAEEIKEAGVSYMSVQQHYLMLELIKATVMEVGAENFSSEAMYNTAQNFTLTMDGCKHSYGPGKVTSSDTLAIYKIDESAPTLLEKMYRADPEWIPVVYEP